MDSLVVKTLSRLQLLQGKVEKIVLVLMFSNGKQHLYSLWELKCPYPVFF